MSAILGEKRNSLCIAVMNLYDGQIRASRRWDRSPTVATTSRSVATLTIAPGVGALYSFQRGAVVVLYDMLAFGDKSGLRDAIEQLPDRDTAEVQEPETNVGIKANAKTLRYSHIFRYRKEPIKNAGIWRLTLAAV